MIQSSLYQAFSKGFKTTLLITKDLKEALEAYEVAKFFCSTSHLDTSTQNPYTPIALPELRAKMGDDMRSFSSEWMELVSKLRDFYAAPKPLLIAPIATLLYKLPSPELLKTFELKKNTPINLATLKETLFYYGYEQVDIVEMEGEVSFRGDIMDIFIPFSKPYRISFFDTECESIRVFDPATQISAKDEQDSLSIPPATFSLDPQKHAFLCEQIAQSEFDSFSKDIASLGFWYLQDESIDFIKTYDATITPNALDEAKEIDAYADTSALKFQDFQALKTLNPPDDGSIDISVDIKNLASIIALNANKKITILTKNPTLLKSLQLDTNAFICVISECVINIATPKELIISLNTYPKPHKLKKSRLGIDELNIGEYIVHNDYGVGVFRGIIQANVLGNVRDFIRIDYQGEDKLLLPVENLHLIERYIAASGNIPVIDRLGKGSFAKLKEKVRVKLFEIADGIISLAAKRNLIEGKKINTQIPEIEVFKNSCGFSLTPDQQKAIDDIFADISSGKAMDRLLSGDVGFGKTEVALNAMFAVYKNGFQSALIVPTTLLCNQHFHTLKSRFEPFGINVAKLDRFIKPTQKAQILKGLAEGSIDVVVGTHSLLGVHFNNLALMVVDEEHKFGVKQKEAIKELSKDMHFLSMSATPIPRTLNMALSDIKGMSTLLTPPIERLGGKTFLKEKTPALLKEIIHRELRRGGQIFYIHNNIATITKAKDAIEELVPNLKIAILHSQIDSKASEEIVMDFSCGKFQMLLCTSIIESGIHLPNANTIIVDGADKFGLADLHQLRGRVGRGSKEGFCYFLINDKKSITDQASKRLLALEKNSYLGSGATIAYHDLEIRGGGNLLGQDQSGHIKNIGYGLYLKMLENAIRELSGKESEINSCVELKLGVSGYLNPDLIPSDRLRLELYRRLSLCKDVSSVYEIQAEIEDRFGKLDNLSLQFLQIIIIKILANQSGIKTISNYAQNISIVDELGAKQSLQSPSKDDDDILNTILEYLRKKQTKAV
ncbi:transcription-repair coupling factor [Helicobacter sp. 11S02596-1]|uniref:transcription-repair coupling factor n=1 Tax=Helicobacter sp. 11S02596-1 TaxID=1476194 RepID=UPI000BA741FC|nr:transcription-repair coupling factor [Helicobacter sp. 11S02596-1]PAF43552.1 transcription-repair coupling factor [Helicobacter sp. 11S02596-1]